MLKTLSECKHPPRVVEFKGPAAHRSLPSETYVYGSCNEVEAGGQQRFQGSCEGEASRKRQSLAPGTGLGRSSMRAVIPVRA